MAAPMEGQSSKSSPASLACENSDASRKTTSAVMAEFMHESHGACDNKDTSSNPSSPVNAKEKQGGMYAWYQHKSCLRRANFASQHHPNVKFLLEAIDKLGSEFVIGRQVCCERCTTDANVSGGFDPVKNEIILCENRAPTQRLTSMLLTHELVHAYDHHKAKVDWTDLKAVACSEIRAANLSGDCSFLSEKFYRWNIGAKHNHEACVRRLAVSSIVATRDLSKEEAEKAVDGVWADCFHDYAPFADIPHRAADMRFSRFSKYYNPR
ncbi:mitochondrial inner membrane protease ATP23 homolog [Acanthaster planci]|uniref:Mitochondrial inner membrane protease ATP23 n=1 Tax=Acanthaster planci TaxID=133434 RepID=A0A8B7XKC4_ACAPL|nr:mitochondrial inner membrane protease ATP23 homolog [Acanthaster planci]